MTYDQVIAYYKTPQSAAQRLGFTTQAIYLWSKKGVPKKSQRLIEAITRGRLKAEK